MSEKSDSAAQSNSEQNDRDPTDMTDLTNEIETAIADALPENTSISINQEYDELLNDRGGNCERAAGFEVAVQVPVDNPRTDE